MSDRRVARKTPFDCTALLLQGGGALGAYQAGVYEALAEHGIEPDWVAGISIGAINSAIIAGNAPADRVASLRTFWEMASAGSMLWGGWFPGLAHDSVIRRTINALSAEKVMLGGVSGFFTPRFPPPSLVLSGTPEAISWYDTAALRTTLLDLVDFKRINARAIRFSVGAVNVTSGNFAYFDNETDTITPEHIMASGALPPGFPPVEIGGEYYWDGGMVSNTPLDWVLAEHHGRDTLVFQVDLWSARGDVPRDMASVAIRMKEVQYSSRSRAATNQFREAQTLRAALRALLAEIPDALATSPEARRLADASTAANFNIVQLVYRSPTYEGQSKDYEFSRQTMEEHWATGYANATATLKEKAVLSLPDDPSGVAVYDIVGQPDSAALHATIT